MVDSSRGCVDQTSSHGTQAELRVDFSMPLFFGQARTYRGRKSPERHLLLISHNMLFVGVTV